MSVALVLLSMRGPLAPIAPGIARPGVVLFSYLNYQLPMKWWPFFLTLHFFWSWLYVMVRLRQEGVASLEMFRSALAEKRIIDVEIVIITALLCLAPGVVMQVSLDGFYFSDQPRWAAVALLLGDAWLLSRMSSRYLAWRERGLFGFSPSQVVRLFVGLPLVASFIITILSWPVAMTRMNLLARKDVSVWSGQPLISLQERIRSGKLLQLFDGAMIERGLANAPGSNVLRELQDISRLPLRERQGTALYIPKSVTRYWDFYREPRNCNWTGFVAPAVAQVAMIDGLPPASCGIGSNHGYGMAAFSVTGPWPADVNRSDSDLCTRATSKGFENVLIAEQSDAGAVRFRKIRCRAS
jgi:hypothetical protein